MATPTRILPHLLAICLLICANTQAAPAEARAIREILLFDIPPQSLATALMSCAEQGHVQIVFHSELVQQQQSSGIRGRYSSVAAIAALLAGTGLHFKLVGENTIVVSAR